MILELDWGYKDAEGLLFVYLAHSSPVYGVLRPQAQAAVRGSKPHNPLVSCGPLWLYPSCICAAPLLRDRCCTACGRPELTPS
eukprot:7068736-Pyramimonas_sp.AAC.1